MTRLDEILAHCLEEVQSGRASLEQVLAEHPAHRDQLEPLLRLALQFPSPADVQPSQEFRVGARRMLQAEIARGQGPARFRILERIFGIRPRLAARGAVALLAGVLLLGGGSGVAYAAQGSLPGDVLYPVKAATEQGRLLVTLGSAAKAEYHLTLARRRLDEVLALAQAERPIAPATIAAIADRLDAALAEVRKLSAADAQRLLLEASTDIAEGQDSLAEAQGRSSPGQGQDSLRQLGLIVGRGQVIIEAASQDPTRLSDQVEVGAATAGEISGRVTSLEPLVIAGVTVVITPATERDGIIEQGVTAEVKGAFQDDGTLRAFRIGVSDDGDRERVKLQGVITQTTPLIVAGRTVVLSQRAEIEGSLIRGLIVKVEGRLQHDGSVLAERLKVEQLKEDTEIRGPILSLDPLTVGGTEIVLDSNTEIEGQLRLGAVAQLEGQLLEDGRVLATELRVEEEQELDDTARSGPVDQADEDGPVDSSDTGNRDGDTDGEGGRGDEGDES